MTKVNIELSDETNSEIEVGQYWIDVSTLGAKLIYLISQLEGEYFAVNINSGRPYHGKGVNDVSNVFYHDRKDFVLVKEINIKIFY